MRGEDERNELESPSLAFFSSTAAVQLTCSLSPLCHLQRPPVHGSRSLGVCTCVPLRCQVPVRLRSGPGRKSSLQGGISPSLPALLQLAVSHFLGPQDKKESARLAGG